MSRHSKWSKIKHHKGAADVKKGALYTKLARAITVAARAGGGDLAANFRLRLAIDKARAANMPKDNVDRAIARGTGELADEAALQEAVYEGYGPGGAAVIVEAATNSRNRTTANVRALFSKYGGTLGASGSVAWMFERRGVVRIAAPPAAKPDLLLSLIDFGAEDTLSEDDGMTAFVQPEKLESFRSAIEGGGIAIANAEVELVPKNQVTVDSAEAREKLEAFLDELEADDDVQGVVTNTDL